MKRNNITARLALPRRAAIIYTTTASTFEDTAVYGLAGHNVAGRLVVALEDISPDRAFVENLAERCNALGVSALHFRDIVEDALAGCY